MISLFVVDEDGSGGYRTKERARKQVCRLKSGDIVATAPRIEQRLPQRYQGSGVAEFLSTVEQRLGEPLTDPIALLRWFESPPVVAGVPVEETAPLERSYVWPGEWPQLKRYGRLSHAERHEVEKYAYQEIHEGSQPEFFKRHSVPERYRVVAVAQGNGRDRYTVQGYWDTKTQTIVEDLTEMMDETMAVLASRYRTDDAVALVRNVRGRFRVTAVDEITGSLVADPDRIRTGREPAEGTTQGLHFTNPQLPEADQLYEGVG